MSDWLDGRRGLRAAADGWLDEREWRLARADRRARRLHRGSPVLNGSLPRVAQLVAAGAPRLAPALVARDTDEVVRALSELTVRGGPTYVKLGQFIATTRGLVPDWIADAFAGCRDAVPPAPAAAVERILERSGVAAELRSWDRRPLASASVAQVHRATLHDGTEVAVKVRRPGIYGTVAADAGYLMPAFRMLERMNERLRVANLAATAELMFTLFAQEIDLELEATNIVEVATALEAAGIDVEVPRPIPGLVRERVLVMELVDGVNAAADDATGFGHHAARLVRLAVAGTLRTALVDGIFHGDLHPGNVLVTRRGLALVDYGIVGRLDERERSALGRFLMAALAEDRLALLAALDDLGAFPPGADLGALDAVLPEPPSMEERLALLDDPGALAARVSDVIAALGAHRFRVPPPLVLFGRNVVYLADALVRHAPDLDLLAELAPMIAAVAGERGERGGPQ